MRKIKLIVQFPKTRIGFFDLKTFYLDYGIPGSLCSRILNACRAVEPTNNKWSLLKKLSLRSHTLQCKGPQLSLKRFVSDLRKRFGSCYRHYIQDCDKIIDHSIANSFEVFYSGIYIYVQCFIILINNAWYSFKNFCKLLLIPLNKISFVAWIGGKKRKYEHKAEQIM